MTESVSSRTKSVTETTVSDSTDRPEFTDRWSNNISYRQLVISSCIGIVQMWWHPYLHDLKKLLPFMFLYNVFSVLIGYPMFYLELALGIVTKKGVLNCWDLAPFARGVGFTMLAICAFSALALSVVAAWCLALLVHSFHSFLPWLHCAAQASAPCAARHRPLAAGAETPAQSFFFNFVLNLKRDGLEGGTGVIVWELAIYYMISWLLIYGIAVKRIYSYSKLVMFKDVMAYFLLVCAAVGASKLRGALTMFVVCDWNSLNDVNIWLEAIEFALVEMTVSQGSLIMLGSYCPKQQHPLTQTAVIAFAASKTTSMGAALTLGAVHGALQTDYDNGVSQIWKGPSSSMILWSDFVARVPGSHFMSIIAFFTLFLLSLTSTALLVQTIMSTFTARSVRKISWVFLVVIALLFCLIGVITLCTQGGLYIATFIFAWPGLKVRAAAAAVASAVITYIYGQTTFCENVYFAVGEYPCVFLRIAWAVAPVVLVTAFVMSTGIAPTADAVAGWTLVMLCVLPFFVVILVYLIFKFRVRLGYCAVNTMLKKMKTKAAMIKKKKYLV